MFLQPESEINEAIANQITQMQPEEIFNPSMNLDASSISNSSLQELSTQEKCSDCDGDSLNNSFSFHCPYQQSVRDNYGFIRLTTQYCPHVQGHKKKIEENKKKYAKRTKNLVGTTKNTIHLDNVLKQKDKRTTVMIRHIPNKYQLFTLVAEINQKFGHLFDVLYLPMDAWNNSNLGFAFINFTHEINILYFYDVFMGRKWRYFNSSKKCQLVYSKVQGGDELISYARKRNGATNVKTNENLMKSLYINQQEKGKETVIEVPLKYLNVFLSYYPYALCKVKNTEVFIVEKYYNF